jgi:uncharacterized membrane protein YoaK (UPF0700 family)
MRSPQEWISLTERRGVADQLQVRLQRMPQACLRPHFVPVDVQLPSFRREQNGEGAAAAEGNVLRGAMSTIAVTDDHPEKRGFPLMEKRSVGFALATVAGLLNAWTLYHAQTFATVQSGNVVQSGYRLVQGDWPGFTFAFGSVIAFGVGAAMCGVLMTSLLRRGWIFTPVVLWIECLLILSMAIASHMGMIDSHVAAYTVSFVAGAQGNAFHKTRGMLYGNVAVTFVVQMAFNFLAQSLFKKEGINGEPNVVWAGTFFLILLGFAAGGAIGFFVDIRVIDHASLFLAATIVLVLALRAMAQSGPVDPTPGGLIG